MLLALAAALVAAAVAVPVSLVVLVSAAADKGAGCARCAADDWLFYLGPLWRDDDGTIRVSKDLHPDHRQELLDLRRSWLATVDADMAGRGMSAPEFESAPQDQESRDAHTVTVVVQVAAVYHTSSATGGPMSTTSSRHRWTFTVHDGPRGWRITAVTMPPWCGTYSRCTPTPAPSSG